MPSRLQQTIAEYKPPTITDEKLEEYLGIWRKLLDQDVNIEVELTIEFNVLRAWPFTEIRTVKYGEEIRQLTWQQFLMVKAWLESLPRK